jgi:hypothetical protein
MNSILVPDHQTDCTIVTLQMRTTTGGWVPVNPCKLMTVTRLHETAAGATSMVRLVRSATFPASKTLRSVVGYRPAAAGKDVLVYSEMFSISG